MEQLLKRITKNSEIQISKEELKKALARLPLENRRAIELKYINKLPKKEIAIQLKWPVSKVNYKLTRGITLLRTYLVPGFFDKANEIMALSRRTFTPRN